MAELGLALLGAYVVVIFGSGYLIRRRTGQSTPFRLRRLRGTALAVAIGMILSLALLVAGPTLGIVGRGGDVTFLSGRLPHVLGVGLFLSALTLVAMAQRAMGASWRVGLDPEDRTELVVTGPFDIVRNPIYVALVGMAAAEGLMVGTVVSLAAVAMVVLSVVLQVHLVEEPYLRRVHRGAFQTYCETTGRFLPRMTRGTRPTRRAQKRPRRAPLATS